MSMCLLMVLKPSNHHIFLERSKRGYNFLISQFLELGLQFIEVLSFLPWHRKSLQIDHQLENNIMASLTKY
ncbi:hypothetical protein VNO78_20144 [Psophocarpus tetragonolobus]|uniref:Uncharacterized protein n=1 Tax=Psophocarpus tetragonolobus TaxID=3891 RepID=A0AAN9S9T5_PSOTE